MVDSRKSALRQLWVQLPFFLWLIFVWMMLWGQFTLLAFLSGVVVAIVTTRVFRLPPVEMSGRMNIWYGFLFVVQFLGALIAGSLSVAWQVWNVSRQPTSAIIAVPLETDDDLIMTHVGVTASLIPGSLVAQTDRAHRVLYLHVFGVRTEADVEKQRRDVLRWEDRIVRAVGSTEQYAQLKQREAARRAEQKGVRS